MAKKIPDEGWQSAHRYVIGAIIGAVVFAGLPEGARWLHRGAFGQSPPAPLPNVIGGGNIFTWNQRGGSNTIIINGERIAVVGSDTIAQIKEHIPAGAKVVITKTLNDSASATIEKQFEKALIDNGYVVTGWGNAFRPTFKGFTISPPQNPNGEYTLTIGDPRL